MNISDIKANFSNYVDFSDDEIAFFLSLVKKKKIANRRFLLKEGEICDQFSLIDSGCMMNYLKDDSDTIHVLQFAFKMWWTADLNSLMNKTPSEYNIRATTDTVVYQLSRDNLDVLYEKVPSFERYFRIIFQNALISHQKRIIENISETAENRYLLFRERYPDLEQLVSQKYIASYLGMTPEFLSKIRKNIHEGKTSKDA